MDKLADAAPVTSPSEYFYSAVTANGQAYLVTRTGADQPAQSYYHRTALIGGHVACFDMKAKSWKSHEFPIIDADENREDELFACGDHLYLLVYSRYNKFTYTQLLMWDCTNAKWTPVKLTMDDNVTMSNDRKFELHAVKQSNVASPDLYFLVTGGDIGGLAVHKLHFASPDAAHMSRTATVDQMAVPQMMQSGWRPLHAVQHGNDLCIIGGCEMCGIRWIADTVMAVDATSGKVQIKLIQGDTPPWSYHGANETMSLASQDKWLMLGGCQAQGMCGTKFMGETWSIDLKGLKWVKEEQMAQLPSGFDNEMYNAMGDGQKLVMLHGKPGLYRFEA